MELSEIKALQVELKELHGYDDEGAWVYLANMLGLNLGVTGKAEVMAQMKYLRTKYAIENARKAN